MSRLLLALAVATFPAAIASGAALSADGATATRQAEITGRPPRVAPRQDLSEEESALALPPKGFGTAGDITTNYRVMLHSPDMVRRSKPIGAFFLLESALPPRDRELMILRTAWLARAPYEWGEHVGIAKKVGIVPAEIERVIAGSTAPGWSDHERALLSAVEELRADSMISDPTWATLARTYSDKQLVEVPMLVGQYQATAYWQNSMRIPLRPSNPGLAAR